jgi:fructosamine-3-kinase
MAPGPAPDSRLLEALTAAFREAASRAAAPSADPPAILSLRRVPGGSINQAYRVETSRGSFFCKWNPGAPPDMFARERDGLEALAGAGSSLAIPRVAALAPAGAEPLLVLEWLEPLPAPAGKSGGRGGSRWEALGRGLAELHRRGADRFGFAADNYCGLTPQENAWTDDWPAFWGDRRIGALAGRLERSGAFGRRETAVFRRLRERLPELLPHGPVPALIHGDLWSGNALLCDRGPALVDPAAYFGDREAEWAMMLLFGGFPDAVLAAYQECWPLPPGWRERLPLYQLYHVLNHALLFGGGYGSQAVGVASRYL